MSNGRNYNRERNGKRFILAGGLDTVHPLDVIPEGSYPYLQNVRANIKGRIVGRPTMGDALFTLAAPPHTIVRLNDTSPNGPAAGYVRVIGAAGAMYVNATAVASGFSGNPLAILPFGPDQSVQPWAYVGDSSQAVTIAATSQACTGMVKVRSDGLTRKTGIKEPQVAPQVSAVDEHRWGECSLQLRRNRPTAAISSNDSNARGGVQDHTHGNRDSNGQRDGRNGSRGITAIYCGVSGRVHYVSSHGCVRIHRR